MRRSTTGPRPVRAARSKAWYLVHKWASLVCTAFMLVVCVSGLPLIFRDEIVGWLDAAAPMPHIASGEIATSLDGLVAQTLQRYPAHRIVEIDVAGNASDIVMALAPGQEAPSGTSSIRLQYDADSGLLHQAVRSADEGLGTRIMTVMIRLHIDFYARLPGQLFLGFMAVLLAVAVISGAVLYHPYMKKIPFGTVRAERARRLKWLDLHNLLGIVTLVWALMMGVTGTIHELAVPLFRYWLANDVGAAVSMAGENVVPRVSPLASVEQAYATAKAAVPGRVVESLRFPSVQWGLPHHYLLWAKGETALGAHLFDGVLVDARNGQLTAVLDMPWYLRVLQFSRPLHYGDTAGLPLKIIWAALDLAVIVILLSGLYLWRKRKV